MYFRVFFCYEKEKEKEKKLLQKTIPNIPLINFGIKKEKREEVKQASTCSSKADRTCERAG